MVKNDTNPRTEKKHGEALLRAADEARSEQADGAHEDNREIAPQFVFVLGDTHLAIPASSIETISAVQPPVPLPHAPEHVLGIIAFGESTLPIVNLHTFLGLRASDEEVVQRVMVVRHNDCNVGIICDHVIGVRTAYTSQLSVPQLIKGGRLQEFLDHELNNETIPVGLLNLGALLEAARVRGD